MSAKTKIAEATTPTAGVEVTASSSYKTIMYSFTGISTAMSKVAAALYEKNPGLVNEIDNGVMEELREGAGLRWQENNPAKGYTTDWIPVGDGEKAAHTVTLAMVRSYSPQAIAAMREPENAKWQALNSVKRKFEQYFSSQKMALIRELKKIDNERSGKTTTRKTVTLPEYVGQTLDNIKQRAKTALARGNATQAEVDSIERGVTAFKAAMNKPVSG